MSVFHLKYRPLKISDLDLIDVSEKFKSILSNKEVPQSFLFAGPKGSGKTSAARILARAVNCENKTGVEPCGECGNCKEILSGASIDVLELDAASNRGIEDVRSLKDKAYLLPSKLKKKVFIIDEVHMMTKEAFNALLKLIEEPPAHTMFILCTTDAEKIPETVLSRLVKVDFRKGLKEELIKSLKRVVEGEKISMSDESYDLIVSKSDGSFRNVHKSLNEIVLLYGNKINKEVVEKYFSQKGGDYSENEFEDDLIAGDPSVILKKLEKLADKGVNFSDFRERLISYFQRRVLTVYGLGEARVEGLVVRDIVRMINLLILASRKEKDVSIDQLPLELAVIEYLGERRGESGKTNQDESEKKEVKIEKKVDNKKKKTVKIIQKTKVVESMAIKNEENLTVGMNVVEDSWGKVLLAVKPFNHSVEAFLRAVKPKKISGDCLVVEVFYPFHKEKLEESKNRRIVEAGLKKVFGFDIGFECVLSRNSKKAIVITNETPVEDIESREKGGDKDMYDVAKEIFG